MLCKCGCGLETKAKCGFYKGHWNKGRKRPDLLQRNIENNCSKNPAVSKKAWETKRKNGYIVWNKNLTTETDIRVKTYVNKRNKNIAVISEKISKTKIERYKTGEIISFWKGKKRPPFSKETRENMGNSRRGKKYGPRSKETKEKLRIATINRIIKQCKFIAYNENSISFFEMLNKKYNLNGIYGKNEFKCIGYSLDFYSREYNLVIEWDEKGHYKNNELLEKDKKRQQNIINYLKCSFIRIKEEYVKDFDLKIIENITNKK
jgi:very-short-patch-repair endonuclease